MIKKILFGLSALALFAACTEDYKDWAEPQKNDPVTSKAFDWSVTAAQDAAFVLDDIQDETIKLFNVTLPEGVIAESFNVKLTGEETKYVDYNITADANGFVSVEDLNKATTEMYTLEAIERTFNAVVSSNFNLEGQTGSVVINKVSEPLVVKVTPRAPTYAPYIYEAGVNNGWGAVEQPLFCANQDGIYVGFFYALDADWSGGKGAFKFTGAFNNWDHGNYGTGTMNDDGLSGTLIDDGGSGNVTPDPGFYRADVNMANMTFKLTRINSVYVVGSALNNDWDNGVEMTYNFEKLCWECDANFTEAGVIKFKGNGTWDSEDGNWGGTMDNIINGSNDNIPVTVSGDVHIEFYPLCETKSYCTITKK